MQKDKTERNAKVEISTKRVVEMSRLTTTRREEEQSHPSARREEASDLEISFPDINEKEISL